MWLTSRVLGSCPDLMIKSGACCTGRLSIRLTLFALSHCGSRQLADLPYSNLVSQNGLVCVYVWVGVCGHLCVSSARYMNYQRLFDGVSFMTSVCMLVCICVSLLACIDVDATVPLRCAH